MATRSFRHARGLTALLALSACVDQRLPTSAPDAPETESRPAVSEVWLTTPDQSRLLERQPDVRLADGAGAHSAAIVVDATHRYQQMTGFGAAVTGSSAWLIRHGLSAGRRDAMMRTLFDPRDGIGLNFVRTSIGASDFSLRAFIPGNAVREQHRDSPVPRVVTRDVVAPCTMDDQAGQLGGDFARGVLTKILRDLRCLMNTEVQQAAGTTRVGCGSSRFHCGVEVAGIQPPRTLGLCERKHRRMPRLRGDRPGSASARVMR